MSLNSASASVFCAVTQVFVVVVFCFCFLEGRLGVHRDSGLPSSACASVLHCNAIFSFVVVCCCFVCGGFFIWFGLFFFLFISLGERTGWLTSYVNDC